MTDRKRVLFVCVENSNRSQMAEAFAHLYGGDASATAGMLYVLITTLGEIFGAHFNPAVTLAMRLRGEIGTIDAIAYVAVQTVAAIAGVVVAHVMFGLDLVQPGVHERTGGAQWLSEAVATFGLLLTIRLGVRHRPAAVPALVASYIFAAYWFTASTSFANPAVTLARALTQTFAGIRPNDVLGFIASQIIGALMGIATAGALLQESSIWQRQP